MPCTKLANFDKENPNYKFLIEGIEDGMIVLHEDKCVALINAAPVRVKFGLGMDAYLRTQGYTSFVAYGHFPQSDKNLD